MLKLGPEELERYDRQLRISGWDEEKQEKLKSATVLIAGVGGLGCSAAVYLAVAGVGNIVLVDRSKVERSNLNRQILYHDNDIGKNKVDAAVKRLSLLNPAIKVRGFDVEIIEENAEKIISGCNVVVDGMDNIATRLILNKFCYQLNIPFVHAAVYGLESRLMTIIPGKTSCLQCFSTSVQPETGPFPVLGAAAGLIACLQAMEVVKLITCFGETSGGNLILIDGEFMGFQALSIQQDENCPVCGKSMRLSKGNSKRYNF